MKPYIAIACMLLAACAKAPVSGDLSVVPAGDGAFRIEKAMIESAPGEFVPLLVFLPDARKFSPPYAGFVFIPGHSDSGKGAEAYLHTCELGARHGLASVIYDPLGQGERSQGAGLRSADEHVPSAAASNLRASYSSSCAFSMAR